MNFAVTNSAASLPTSELSEIATHIQMSLRTKSHYFGEISGPKLDHNRIGVAIDDMSIMSMPVGYAVFSFYFLQFHEYLSRSKKGK